MGVLLFALAAARYIFADPIMWLFKKNNESGMVLVPEKATPEIAGALLSEMLRQIDATDGANRPARQMAWNLSKIWEAAVRCAAASSKR